MWDAFAPWIGAGGFTGAVALVIWYVNRLHNDAVAAERRRADDHMRTAETWKAIAAERERQLYILLGRKEPPT